jgi:hypothetical protein
VADVPTWWLIGAPFAGYAAALLTEALRDRRVVERAREERAHLRGVARDERHDAFQRETLEALQDALLCVMRQAARVDLWLEDRYRETGEWGRIRMPDELVGISSLALHQDVQRLASRVADDEIRTQVERLLDGFTFAGEGAGEDELDHVARGRAQHRYGEALVSFDPLINRIGELLRDLNR